MLKRMVPWLLPLLLTAAGCSKEKKHDQEQSCDAAPGAPTALAAVGKSTAIAVLSWTAPEDDGGDPCTLQRYQVSMDGAPVTTSSGTIVAVTGLTPGSTHSFTVAAVNEHGPSAPSDAVEITTDAAPDFGPNTHVYDTTMAAEDVEADIQAVYAPQFSDVTGQFDTTRAALLFKPGAYALKVPVGYYMQVLGVGARPDDTTITGVVTSYGHWSGPGGASGYNATQNFWRGLENFSVVPTNDTDPLPDGTPNTLGAGGAPYMRWAVSQACPFRRMHVQGDLALHHWGGWASGGWMSDSKIDGQIDSGSQQQWITRNSSIGAWSAVNWNMVFLGVDHPFVDLFENGWDSVRTTIVEATPRVREKPFLHVDDAGRWFVLRPGLRTDTTGVTWAGGQTPGVDVSIDDFFVARPGVAVATINAALAAGKHLLLTPGIYHLDGTIQVTQPGTIVLGIGMATLHPDTGLAAMTVADVDGVTVAGVLFDAGSVRSPVLLQVGEEGAAADHSADPTLLADVFMRIGGAEDGKADAGMIINSHDVIGDHFWIWRADHGTATSPTGWTLNPSRNGLVVNGDDVTIYGLFVEHFEEYQTLWNGEHGRVYFYQSEDPYDVPDQASWMSHDGAKNGYASYKVADTVADHQAWGLGVYSVFNVFPADQASAIEVPDAPGMKLHHMITFGLSQGTITHVINDQGAVATVNPWAQGLVAEYPVGPPPPAPASLVFPLDFESTPNVRYGFVSWGNGLQFGIVHDPDDATHHVLAFQRRGGDSWAGFSIDGGDATHWLAANPFDTSKVFTLSIKCDTASVPVLLKLENPADNTQSVELSATTTTAVGTWQTLTFDFSAVTIAAGVPYTRLDLFPGWAGGSSPGVDSYCLIDDLTLVTP